MDVSLKLYIVVYSLYIVVSMYLIHSACVLKFCLLLTVGSSSENGASYVTDSEPEATEEVGLID